MNQKDFKDKSELQIFLSYFKPHRKLFFLDMVCALAIAMIDLAFPFISRWCMYKLLPDNAWRTFWTVMAVVTDTRSPGGYFPSAARFDTLPESLFRQKRP